MGVRRYHHGGRAGVPERHTFGSTLVWGGFALIVGEGKRSRAWLAFAGAVVGIVSLSRLVLGVHYLVDVVVGVGLGLVVLGALYVVADRGTVPGRVLLVSVGVGVLGLLQGPPSRAWPRSEAPSARGSCGAASPIRRRPTRRTAEKSVPDPSSSDSQGFLRAPVRHRTTAAGRVLRFRHRRRQYGRRPAGR